MKRWRRKTREMVRIPFILIRGCENTEFGRIDLTVKSKRCKICHKTFYEKKAPLHVIVDTRSDLLLFCYRVV